MYYTYQYKNLAAGLCLQYRRLGKAILLPSRHSTSVALMSTGNHKVLCLSCLNAVFASPILKYKINNFILCSASWHIKCFSYLLSVLMYHHHLSSKVGLFSYGCAMQNLQAVLQRVILLIFSKSVFSLWFNNCLCCIGISLPFLCSFWNILSCYLTIEHHVPKLIIHKTILVAIVAAAVLFC